MSDGTYTAGLIAAIGALATAVVALWKRNTQSDDGRIAECEKRFEAMRAERDEWKELALRGLRGTERGVFTTEVAVVAAEERKARE